MEDEINLVCTCSKKSEEPIIGGGPEEVFKSCSCEIYVGKKKVGKIDVQEVRNILY